MKRQNKQDKYVVEWNGLAVEPLAVQYRLSESMRTDHIDLSVDYADFGVFVGEGVMSLRKNGRLVVHGNFRVKQFDPETAAGWFAENACFVTLDRIVDDE